MLTSEQLKQIRWHSNGCATVAGDGPWKAVCDACALREAVPALLDTVKELQELLERAESCIQYESSFDITVGHEIKEALR